MTVVTVFLPPSSFSAGSAKAFLAEELADVCYVRLKDILPRWQRRGGNYRQLLRAVQRGPYVARREAFDGDLLWIYHADGRREDAYDRMVADRIRRWREEQERDLGRG